MNPIDWLRNYAFDTHFDRGDSLTECHLEQSTEFLMILEALEKELEAARRERDDLRDLVVHCWVHSGYVNCGYAEMTSEQKLLFDAARREQTPQAGKEG